MRLFSKTSLILFVVISVIAGWLYFSQEKPQDIFTTTSQDSEEFGEVKKQDIVQKSTLSGFIEPHSKAVIKAPFKGYVTRVYVKIGDTVKVGDPLITVVQSLNVPNIESFPIRSAIAGKVVQLLTKPGQYVDPSYSESTLLRVDDLSKLHVSAEVPELDIINLKITQNAIIKATAVIDRTYKGQVEEISLASTAQDNWRQSIVNFKVNLLVSEFDQNLKPGMSVVADVVTGEKKDVLALKHEFIERDGEKYFVDTVEGERKEIEVGMKNEEVFEIVSGLSQGDKVKQVDFLKIAKKSK